MDRLVSIFIRNAEYQIPAGKPTDVIIPEYNIIVTNSVLARGVTLWSNVNVYGAEIGENTRIGAFVEVRNGVKIGSNVKIEPFVYIPEGVTVEDAVFIGPGVVFTNDLFPRATGPDGRLAQGCEPVLTRIRRSASIGARACIRCWRASTQRGASAPPPNCSSTPRACCRPRNCSIASVQRICSPT